MNGVITNWDILFHPIATIKSFGWRVFGRAVFAKEQETFLSLLAESDIFCQSESRAAELIERAIDFELRTKSIYDTFTQTFRSNPPAARFFDALSQQEQSHVDILRLCQLGVAQDDFNIEYLNLGQLYLPRLEEKIQAAENAARAITDLDEALRLVIQLELSELNKLFQAILKGSNSAFVNKMDKFQTAVECHLRYIATMLPQLSPNLARYAAELDEKKLEPVAH